MMKYKIHKQKIILIYEHMNDQNRIYKQTKQNKDFIRPDIYCMYQLNKITINEIFEGAHLLINKLSLFI